MSILSFLQLCPDKVAVVLWAVHPGKLDFWRQNLALRDLLTGPSTHESRRVHLVKLDVKNLILRTLHIQCWLDHGADRPAHVVEKLASFARIGSCCGTCCSVLEAGVRLADLCISLGYFVQLA